MSLKKIYYLVATQYDNMGDLLINRCLIKELSLHGHVFLDTKGVPNNFKQHLLDFPNVSEFNGISYFSLKGKGLLLLPFFKNFGFKYAFKSPGPFGGDITILNKIKGYILYSMYRYFKLIGVKSYFVGNDFLIRSDYDENLLYKYANVLESIYVRSLSNENVLKNLGLLNVGYSPDMCFLLSPDIDDSIDKNMVSISFRDLGTDNEKSIKNSINLFINYYLRMGKKVEFFFQVERDRDYNYSLYENFKGEGVSFRNSVLVWADRDYYKDKFAVLSNRLHVLLLGQVYNCFPVGIVKDNEKTLKIKNIFDSIGYSDAIFEDLDVLYLEALANKNAIQHMINITENQRNKLKAILNNILK